MTDCCTLKKSKEPTADVSATRVSHSDAFCLADEWDNEVSWPPPYAGAQSRHGTVQGLHRERVRASTARVLCRHLQVPRHQHRSGRLKVVSAFLLSAVQGEQLHSSDWLLSVRLKWSAAPLRRRRGCRVLDGLKERFVNRCCCSDRSGGGRIFSQDFELAAAAAADAAFELLELRRCWLKSCTFARARELQESVWALRVKTRSRGSPTSGTNAVECGVLRCVS